MKMLITLGLHGIFCSKFCILVYFKHCHATDMQNGDEASPSIILAGRALLMKMLIILELRGIFCSNFVYYCILTLSNR